jgi:hypothetical protein
MLICIPTIKARKTWRGASLITEKNIMEDKNDREAKRYVTLI